jgi:vacuolar protein sorting-associated protein 45
LSRDEEFINKLNRGSNNNGEVTVIILDRREDPVSPLLNQWTYQAMINELLGIHNNRVDLKHLTHLPEEMREVVLSCDDDAFFKKIMFSNFGDVAESIHTLVQTFLQSKKS